MLKTDAFTATGCSSPKSQSLHFSSLVTIVSFGVVVTTSFVFLSAFRSFTFDVSEECCSVVVEISSDAWRTQDDLMRARDRKCPPEKERGEQLLWCPYCWLARVRRANIFGTTITF
jgi:hypothetical protein